MSEPRVTFGDEFLRAIQSENQDAIIAEVDALLEGCCAVLRNHHPIAQGYALAHLVALYMNGHYPPEVRRNVLAIHLKLLRRALKEGL